MKRKRQMDEQNFGGRSCGNHDRGQNNVKGYADLQDDCAKRKLKYSVRRLDLLPILRNLSRSALQSDKLPLSIKQ